MQQTTNYQLNQWDPGDRILRENFNSDNAKVDAAMKAAADAATAETAALRAKVTAVESKAGCQVIRTVAISSTAKSVNIYLTDMDWNAWQTVYISFNVQTTLANEMVGIYLNGSSNPELGGIFGNQGGTYAIPMLILYPMFEKRRQFNTISFTDKAPQLFTSTTTFQRFSYLTLTAYNGNQISAGSTITIWGVK